MGGKMMNPIGKEFIEKTKYQYLGESDQAKELPQPPLELEYDQTKQIIELPKPSEIKMGDESLRVAIEQRRSCRKYVAKSLSLDELSYLLWCTQGVMDVTPPFVTLRTVPSAGARHAFETILLINNVEGLEPGLYRFLAIEHKLVQLRIESDLAEKITKACLGQTMVQTSAVTFIWVAVSERMKWRYGERGYRYLHLDAGHVCQNLYLIAEGINCGVCAIAAYQDDELNRILNLDGEQQFVIYLATLGKIKEG